MATNKYTSPPQLPLKFTSTPSSITHSSASLCTTIHQFIQNLVSTTTPSNATFTTVLEPLLQQENEIQLTTNLIKIYSLVSPVPEVRRAAAEASDKLENVLVDCRMGRMGEGLWRLVEEVYERQREDEGLDVEMRKALVDERRGFVRKGMGLLSGDTVVAGRVSEIGKRLKSIRSEYMRNRDEKEHFIWFSRDELVGVPEDRLAALDIGKGEFEGKLGVDLGGPDGRWILSLAEDPKTRERIYLGMRLIASENVPLFNEAIQLRHESAQLLGYPNHMAYKLEVTMAKTPAAAIELVESIRDRVVRQLPNDIGNLLELKKNDPAAQGHEHADILLWSDLPYYSRLYEESNYSIDQELIAEYFPLHQTISKMLILFGNLFGFVFIEITNNKDSNALDEGLIWHEDVILYSVWNTPDEGNQFVGYLYLDLYSRPGKTGGFQCRPLHLGFVHPDGRRHYPSTVLITNFSKPTATKPTLLQHSDVVVLFHELGHGIHDLSGRCKYARFHGAETVGDFNEAPSQMLENWCWDSRALPLLSGHYETGDPLPQSMIDALVESRTVLAAVKILPQSRVTLFDTVVHSTAPEKGVIDVAGIYQRFNGLGGIGSFRDLYGYASYRHLFSGSDSAMYGYLWSKVLAMDMFDAVFKADPLDGGEGRRYRHEVLEKGGSQDEMDTFVGFMGREPSVDAFNRSLGLD